MREFDEPISPELVLVSPPEVVARARALLLETELACSADPHERGPEQKSAVSLPLPAPAVDRAPVVRSGRTRRSSGRVVVALVTCALAVAAAFVVYERRSASAPSSSPTSEALGAQSSIRNSAGATAPRAERRTAGRPAARPAQTKPAQRRRARVGPAVKTRHAARVAARPKKERLTKSARLRSTAAPFVPARLFTWPARRDVTTYIVRFFRNGKNVLQLRTKRPQVVLPKRFRFKAGTYRWQVIPVGGGSNGGQPIVDSKFVLTAATAARAP